LLIVEGTVEELQLLDPATAAFAAAFSYFLDMSDAIDKVLKKRGRNARRSFTRRMQFAIGFCGAVLQIVLRVFFSDVGGQPSVFWIGLLFHLLWIGSIGGVCSILLYKLRTERLSTAGGMLMAGSMTSVVITLIVTRVSRSLL
jgi:hypothetical protein